MSAVFALSDRGRRVYLAVWLVLLAVVAGAGVGLLLAAHRPPPPAALGGGVVLRAGAVRAPTFHLRDQTGRLVSPADFQGRVVALTFLDTQCLSMCPLQASLLGSVQADLGPRAAPSVLVVSVHPEADTPSAIAGFAAGHGLAGDLHWVSGSQADLAHVWDSYGVGVQVATGDVQHTSVIFLIDRSGYERVAFADLPDQAAVERDVRLLEQGA